MVLKAVVHRERGPRSQEVRTPHGIAIVCGPASYIDTLECGHTVEAWSGAKKRRCKECDK